MKKKTKLNSNELKQITIKYGIILLIIIITLSGITGCAMQTKGYEKEIFISANGTLHYNKDINKIIPTQIVHYMNKKGLINPLIPTEIYLNVENNTYHLKFVKDEDVLNSNNVLFSFNALEIKLNSTLNLDKKIIVEFLDKDLTRTFALPHGNDVICQNAVNIFKLKSYDIDDFHTIQYNKTMPISEVKKIGEAVKKLKYYFPENQRINMVFINNGLNYTFKLFLLKKYWNNPTDLDRSRSIIKYFNECGISKKINLMFVDFMTYEEIKI